ncbi:MULTISPECIES: 50S ribosomal protein L25/general stress protein Ctc [Acidithiobacillus]|uniref:Large ribosomal subunit protein bL25 n=1 Tax=Acidithiobacillus thiooxidans ATCC 19377 TaxID=637390 RepID=A0A5P9XN05_ACITH|nr:MULTISPECIES: 50S ribosomal protein L25/general stress protein Ctc [Acidithiobacillus]MBU2741941.1 50S ribosomal protein L25/general stress protein Ctc [Acidithiobacillus albertensis]MBU2752013.1 50S ribosomal protein L25/general stress protein Ctc [Acidithiobacillus thiooxidans]MBU2792404.1 50S ribosomal protein L25/general stress protein Ctc [Acidithiobacillus thiooxidans]MBU2834904.1 50S ribosomal protein L25/general stress protein Ctc [Acidithiobacillus thiooxidans]MDA8177089.1 50S ribo
MTDFAIAAMPREENGRRASRRLRRTGMVPAVLYGDNKAAMGLSIEARLLRKLLADERAYTHVIALEFPKGKETALIRDIQMHPYKEEVLHMDFMRVHAGETVRLHVPIHFLHENTCVGIKAGGVLHRALTDVEVEAPVDRLPEAIEVDIAKLEKGESLHLSQISVPAGVILIPLQHEDDKEIVSIHSPRTGAEAEEEAPEAAE